LFIVHKDIYIYNPCARTIPTDASFRILELRNDIVRWEILIYIHVYYAALVLIVVLAYYGAAVNMFRIVSSNGPA
jgi:hypothetical protein